jgi:toxin ParE1/3/4
MANNVSKRPAALADLEESGSFIGRDSLAAELRFYEAAESTFKQLAQMPGLGRERTDLTHERLRGLRSFPVRGFDNWLVFYRSTADGIEIIRVLHGARDLEDVLKHENITE